MVLADQSYSSTTRADSSKLKVIFEKYASVRKESGPTEDGKAKHTESYMTYEDFVNRFLGLLPTENFNKDTLKTFANIVDSNKDQLISFEEFQAFEALLCAPDSLFATAFRIFDVNSNGFVTFDEFRDVMRQSILNENIPFNFDSDFVALHFGKDKKRAISFTEFTQLLREFYEEHALQAFRQFDRDHDGLITVSEFNQIMILLKNHLLTDFVSKNLVSIVSGRDQARQVSFSYFTAFISLLNNMELVKRIYQTVSRGNSRAAITKEQFLQESQKYTQITPLEIEILYQIASVDRRDGLITLLDIQRISPLRVERMPYTQQATLQQAVETKNADKGRSFFITILESGYRFFLGGIAGATGATAVYPIDLVKTRMQNQRITQYSESRLYKNSWDCFLKVIKFEGFFGLYRGLLPQLVGVAPEKAIKLTVNDLIKDLTADKKTGEVALPYELLAGGCAGGSQVIFTNPLEIVKIRLQTAGEVAGGPRTSAIRVVRELGLFGLYKGSSACFLRDIPFSAIYFPAYNHMKMFLADENGYNKPTSLLIAATCAGVPAAFLPTPADVVKTRLQVQARKGQTTYKGLRDAFVKIWQQEGFRAFWKGSAARVFRSSPQFGVTLSAYEMLQRWFYVDFGGRKLSGMGERGQPGVGGLLPVNPEHIGGYKLALATFEGIESKFGICFPKFASLEAQAVAVHNQNHNHTHAMKTHQEH